jgi:thiosulfate dehydrogenase [quinone] large subunit
MAQTSENIPEPKISKLLFGSSKMGWIYLPIRLYVGYEWIMAGWGKVNSPVWTGAKAGVALSGFLNGALAKTVGEHPDVAGWYAGFLKAVVLPNAATFSHFVAYGELLVGIGLILGAFTGVAAFFGAFMNMNYLFAGTISTNPLLFLFELLLFLGWRVAGSVGVDRYLLPMLGVPWKPGKLFKK